MNRWSALAVLLAFAGALAFRLPQLDVRPLHNDEAVNATKVAALWEQGHYRYDPDEYHGPTLHYATAPFLSLSGAGEANDLGDGTLRLATVFFGAGLILLSFLFRGGISGHALAWSALFIAISPAMVFYSRYFIHEMLLVFFSGLVIAAGWRYTQTRCPGWAVTTGAALGLMFATKETFVLSLAAMAAGCAALVLTRAAKPWNIRAMAGKARWRDVALAAAATFVVWLVFFSSFFTHFRGLLDSALTYVPWLKRAAGDSPHLHPWYFYLQRLGWFQPVKGPVWSEGLILGLAVLGMIAAWRRNGGMLPRFLAVYSIVLLGIYSVISYKTPWCLLGFYHGLILLAGVGAAAMVEWFRARAARVGIAIILLAATGQLAVQAWRASFEHATDRRNPYVYAQTVPDILNLVKRADGLSQVSKEGYETVVKVISPESDYWPLPWYLRRFHHVGWYERLPEDPFAPIIIVSAKLDARLDDVSNRKWIMAGLSELRPGQFFELYVELELWKKYVEALPPVADAEDDED